MSAKEVIIAAMNDAYKYDANGADSDDILSALKAAGYAVVELPAPKPTSEKHADTWYFDHDVMAYPGGVLDVDADLAPEDARSLGLALLAAANAAEANQ